MKLYLLIAIFGAIGSVTRYFFFIITPKYFVSFFPLSTLIVNIIGSFLIGIVISLFDKNIINETLRATLAIGLLGGFTTFSTFSMDMFNLINKSLYFYAFVYIIASVFLGLFFYILGLKISSFFSNDY